MSLVQGAQAQEVVKYEPNQLMLSERSDFGGLLVVWVFLMLLLMGMVAGYQVCMIDRATQTEPDDVQLEDLTIEAMRERARRLRLVGVSKSHKGELAAAIRKVERRWQQS